MKYWNTDKYCMKYWNIGWNTKILNEYWEYWMKYWNIYKNTKPIHSAGGAPRQLACFAKHLTASVKLFHYHAWQDTSRFVFSHLYFLCCVIGLDVAQQNILNASTYNCTRCQIFCPSTQQRKQTVENKPGCALLRYLQMLLSVKQASRRSGAPGLVFS